MRLTVLQNRDFCWSAIAVLVLAIGSLSMLPWAALAASSDAAAYEFLVQKICVDHSDKALSVDPYDCPAGNSLRSLKPGESLPYHRHDQYMERNPDALQRRDSYPVVARSGEISVVNLFDYAPFGQFNTPRDGYDITVVRNGWASISATSAKNGATTFFTTGCKPYNGWVLFPVSALDGSLVRAGQEQVPIKGVHWGKEGGTWPGPCPSHYQTESWTSWEPLPKFHFGGFDNVPVKTIDAIRSIHGFIDRPQFLKNGHLEVFYFTRLYGFTRWESWMPKQHYSALANAENRSEASERRCGGPGENVYRGVTFERVACREWTFVDVLSKPEPPPQWPAPGVDQ